MAAPERPAHQARPLRRSLRQLAGTVGDSVFGAHRGAPAGSALEAVSAAARSRSDDNLTLRLLSVRAQRTLSRATGARLFSHPVFATAHLDDLLAEAAWAHEQFDLTDRLAADDEARTAVRREMRIVREVLWWLDDDHPLADAVTYALDAAALARELPANVVEALSAPLLIGVAQRDGGDPGEVDPDDDASHPGPAAVR